MIRLFVATGCAHTSLAYWTDAKSASALEIEAMSPTSPHLIGKARINGQDIRGVLDTGAAFSVLTLQAASRAGARPEDPKVRPAGLIAGIGPKASDSWIAPFDELAIGDELIKRVPLRIGDVWLG